MHEALVGPAQMRCAWPHADFVGYDAAAVAGRFEIPSVIEARLFAGRITIPADAVIGVNSLTRLSSGSPKVVHRKTLPALNSSPPLRKTPQCAGVWPVTNVSIFEGLHTD
jgi:hypothetical protein